MLKPTFVRCGRAGRQVASAVLLFVGTVTGFATDAATFYIAPAALGTGSGFDDENPKGMSEVNTLIRDNQDIILQFAPGTYELTAQVQRLASGGTPGNYTYINRKIALIGKNPCRHDFPTVFKWKDNVHTDPGNDDGWREVQMVSLNGQNQDPAMERIVIENIIFDGNFDKQTQVVGPHFREGYKSLAVVAAAKSGRIRNCMIRDFGSQGFMPGGLGAPAGVESFQLLITATDPVPATTGENWPNITGNDSRDSHNWIIEDNEISNLHFAYGGYATAIVLNAPGTGDWNPLPAADTVHRVGIVRRNVVRGRSGDRLPIGLGAASFGNGWAGRVTFADNVVLNAELAFNTDTGVLRDLDFVHNMFLDVGGIGNIGVAATSAPYHSYYTVKENCVRLRGRTGQKYYNDYRNNIGSSALDSDPSLDLWRPLRSPATGLTIQGRCDGLVFRDNRFATWPSPVITGTTGIPPTVVVGPDNFLSVPFPLAAAGTGGDGWWVPRASWESVTLGANWWSFLVPYAANTDYTEQHYWRFRYPAVNVTLANNSASSVPFYFTTGTPYTDTDPNNGGAIIASLPQGVSETTSLAHTKMRQPLAATATQFQPIGFIGRAAPVFEDDPGHPGDAQYKKLSGVAEVAIDKIEYHPPINNEQAYVVIRARVAEHRCVGPGSPTYVWKSGYVFLQLLGDQTVPGAYPYGVAASEPVRLALDANGLATFKIANMALLPNWRMIIAPRVWIEGIPATGGAMLTENRYQQGDLVPAMPALGSGEVGDTVPPEDNIKWDENRDAWAEARLVVTTGPGACAVSVFTQPDVANEKSGKRAKLIFTRTGSKVAPLAVRVSIPVSTLAGTPFIRRGSYGASGAADYYFDWSSATYLASVPDALNRPVTGSTGMVSILPTEPTAGQPTDGYVVFPANSERVIVDVVARADEVFERETAYVRIEASPVSFYSGGSQYGSQPYLVVEPKEVAVILYDGPTWSLIELSSVVYDASYPGGYRPATASLAWALNQEANAKTAGWVSLPAVQGGSTAYNRMGWWANPVSIPGNELYAASPLNNGLPVERWYGLSTTTPTLVGTRGDRAYKWQIGGSGSYPNVQPPIPTPPGPPPVYFLTTSGSAIYGVSPNNTYMAGKATPTTSGAFARPMRWENGNPIDLVGSSPSFTSGEARGVDDSGTTVGHVNLNYSKRAFRVANGAIDPAAILNKYRYPCLTGNCSATEPLWDSQAFGIAPKVNGTSAKANYTVGSSTTLLLDTKNTPETADDTWIPYHEEAAVSWDGNGSPILIGGNYLPSTRSRALAINDLGEIVGWSGTPQGNAEWTGNGTVTSSAFVCRGVGVYSPVTLNDKHFVHGLTGWNLAVASGINNQGWIVGIGTKSGQTRGFLLRKLSN